MTAIRDMTALCVRRPSVALRNRATNAAATLSASGLLARLFGGWCRRDGFRSRRSGRALLAQPFLLFFLLLGQISLAFGKGVIGFGQLAILVGGWESGDRVSHF